MREEHGLYDGSALPCGHVERMELSAIVLCPTCDTWVLTKYASAAYKDVLAELVNVQHFDTANALYLNHLERALAELDKMLKNGAW